MTSLASAAIYKKQQKMRMIVNTWGLNQSMMHWFYTIVVIPVMTYSSVICRHKAKSITASKYRNRNHAISMGCYNYLSLRNSKNMMKQSVKRERGLKLTQ